MNAKVTDAHFSFSFQRKDISYHQPGIFIGNVGMGVHYGIPPGAKTSADYLSGK
jgi:hypothetical protein